MVFWLNFNTQKNFYTKFYRHYQVRYTEPAEKYTKHSFVR